MSKQPFSMPQMAPIHRDNQGQNPRASHTVRQHRYPFSSYGYSIPLSIVIVLSIALLGCVLHSSFYHQLDPKACLMTYMQPTYYRIQDFGQEKTSLAGKYALLLYRDEGDDHPALQPGEFTQKGDYDWTIAPSVKIRPTGIPALFIPGNAGSARQVRSIARETISWHKPGSQRFDFFTVDFNEEFSAFHGQLLLDQAQYINDAIRYILSLYDESYHSYPKPTSVLIIGHSMGGIVARTIFLKENYLPGSVHAILTLATPHMVPPLALDHAISSIYDRIESFWREGFAGPDAALKNVSLVSILGGNQDITVNSDAGNVHHLIPQSQGFSVFTTAIPHAWVGSDHLSILWCSQIVKQIGRALVDIVESTRPERVKSLERRMEILRRHLVRDDHAADPVERRSGENIRLSEVSHSFVEGHIWVSPISSRRRGASHYQIFTIPKNSSGGADTFTMLTNQEFGPNNHYQLLLCKHESKRQGDAVLSCQGSHLSTVAIPASTSESTLPLFKGEFYTGHEFRFISSALQDLAPFHYIVLRSSGAEQPISSFVLAECTSQAANVETVQTSALGLLRSGLQRASFPQTPALFSKLVLPNVDNSLLTYTLKVEGGNCQGALFQPMMMQSSWSTNEDRFAVNVAAKASGMDINFHGDLPYYDKVHVQGHNGIELHFWRDPTCQEPLSLSLRVDTYGSLGKVVIRYRTIVIVFTFMVVILTIRAQLKEWAKYGEFRPFGIMMSELTKTTYWQFPVILIVFAGIQSLGSKRVDSLEFSPKQGAASLTANSIIGSASTWFDDALLGRNETLFWLLVPAFFQVAVGIVALVWIILNTIIKVVARIIGVVTDMKDSLTRTSGRKGISFSALDLWISVVPYQFVFAATFLALIGTSARAQIHTQRVSSAHLFAAWNSFHLSASMLMVFFFLLPFCVPSLMVWIRNIVIGWYRSFPSDHRVDYVAPFIIFVQGLAGGGDSAGINGALWRRPMDAQKKHTASQAAAESTTLPETARAASTAGTSTRHQRDLTLERLPDDVHAEKDLGGASAAGHVTNNDHNSALGLNPDSPVRPHSPRSSLSPSTSEEMGFFFDTTPPASSSPSMTCISDTACTTYTAAGQRKEEENAQSGTKTPKRPSSPSFMSTPPPPPPFLNPPLPPRSRLCKNARIMSPLFNAPSSSSPQQPFNALQLPHHNMGDAKLSTNSADKTLGPGRFRKHHSFNFESPEPIPRRPLTSIEGSSRHLWPANSTFLTMSEQFRARIFDGSPVEFQAREPGSGPNNKHSTSSQTFASTPSSIVQKGHDALLESYRFTPTRESSAEFVSDMQPRRKTRRIVEGPYYKERSHRMVAGHVRKLIQEAVEDGIGELDLSNLELNDLPSEIRDLSYAIAYSERGSFSLCKNRLKLFLSSNNFSTIPMDVFSLHNLSVLSIRNNNIENIPPEIGLLHNLVELSIGGNLLKSLPYQIALLPKLHILTLHPNPFLPLPYSRAEINDSSPANLRNQGNHPEAAVVEVMASNTQNNQVGEHGLEPEIQEQEQIHQEQQSPFISSSALPLLHQSEDVEMLPPPDELVPASSSSRIAAEPGTEAPVDVFDQRGPRNESVSEGVTTTSMSQHGHEVSAVSMDLSARLPPHKVTRARFPSLLVLAGNALLNYVDAHEPATVVTKHIDLAIERPRKDSKISTEDDESLQDNCYHDASGTIFREETTAVKGGSRTRLTSAKRKRFVFKEEMIRQYLTLYLFDHFKRARSNNRCAGCQKQFWKPCRIMTVWQELLGQHQVPVQWKGCGISGCLGVPASLLLTSRTELNLTDEEAAPHLDVQLGDGPELEYGHEPALEPMSVMASPILSAMGSPETGQ
ncbi:GPI inositol deacylase [Mortierella claussenii]|nr:GPI inositol deacylase [Mortierella claussenii]